MYELSYLLRYGINMLRAKEDVRGINIFKNLQAYNRILNVFNTKFKYQSTKKTVNGRNGGLLAEKCISNFNFRY